jgi:hypothetical protein
VSRGTSYFIARDPHLLIGNRAKRHAESALQPLDARCIPFSDRAVTFARNMSPRKRKKEKEREREREREEDKGASRSHVKPHPAGSSDCRAPQDWRDIAALWGHSARISAGTSARLKRPLVKPIPV